MLDVIAEEKLCARADAIGKIILERCNALKGSNLNCVGDVRGLGAMCAIELVKDTASGEPAPALTQAVMKVANEKGLILLSCGTYGNVIRFLVPLTASDELVRRGHGHFRGEPHRSRRPRRVMSGQPRLFTSCPALSRASRAAWTEQAALDCRVKPGNDEL